jgi:RNA methyltransferase, TrmH family
MPHQPLPIPRPPRRHAEAGQALPPRPHQRRLLRICGLAAVRALFERAPSRVERLFFEPRLKADLAAFCGFLGAVGKPYRQADAATLARVGGTARHGGVVAVALPQPIEALDPRALPGWARDGKPILLLDGVGNPHNLGAIVRTAAFLGLERVVLADRPEQAFPSDASYRIAEGGFEHLSLYRARLPAAFSVLRRAYHIVGTAPVGSATPPIFCGERPSALVFVNEETGLDPQTLAACDAIATIPGCGRAQSLNVAAAAAILIYLATRPGRRPEPACEPYAALATVLPTARS